MIARTILRHAEHRPGAIALHYGEDRITYAELARRIRAAMAMLEEEGVGHGDCVAFLGHNHPSQIVLLVACAGLGAVLLPLNWRLAPPELRTIIEDSGAALLLALPEMVVLARSAAPEDCPVLDAAADWPEAPEFGPEGLPLVTEMEDRVLLAYTSGTTGDPKGVPFDHLAVMLNAMNSQHMHGLAETDRVLTVLPMFHLGGLNIQTMPALLFGAEVVLLPRFEPEAFFAACARLRPSLTLLVPAVMQALIAHPDWATADLSSLRAIGAGSSEVPLPLIEAFHARGIPVQQVYGATETGPIAIYQTRAEALAYPGSIGRQALHGVARVVDAEGEVLPPGMVGEIEVQGRHVARSYWNEPEGGEEAWREGWFATGDLAWRDAEGRFWFADRLKHLIISGGENIYPAEVERVLRTDPGVIECAVCGRPDPRWGEVPVAVVVPGPGFDAARLLAHCEGRLARFKHPHAVVAVKELPRTALGKIQLEALRLLAQIDQG
ncbi:class I adenylate-forming enzyme family protein [Belnapia rosea]|uniref:class I adenylate-forming enzyme family protein n=1 Tax=Belnapia rosea TaxID=938405 RepID=UPI00088563C1|nr:AMP-binding protein [Belnapia rosea]SDB69656.1 fatty-acyl-CoA synthase [Belnapia rosea]